MPPATPYVLFDLEYATDHNARELGWGGFGQHKEVIQIGAAIIEPGQPWESLATFNCYVQHAFTEHNAYTEDLTGIPKDLLEREGLAASVAFAKFHRFLGGYIAISNGNDINQLAETAGLQRFVMPFNPLDFGSLMEPMYAALEARATFDRREYPSGRVHELMGIPEPVGLGPVHNALRDVWSLHATLEALRNSGSDVIAEVRRAMLVRKLRFAQTDD